MAKKTPRINTRNLFPDAPIGAAELSLLHRRNEGLAIYHFVDYESRSTYYHVTASSEEAAWEMVERGETIWDGEEDWETTDTKLDRTEL